MVATLQLAAASAHGLLWRDQQGPAQHRMSPWSPFSRRRTSLLPHVTVLQGALEDLALLMHLCLEKNGVAMGGPWLEQL